MRGWYDNFDEHELLAFVEGELDAAASNRLVARLEGHPEARAALQHMKRDRDRLRSIGEPALPRDFLAELEPLLSRSMLMETVPAKPGAYRRQKHARATRPRWTRYAAAAMIFLSLAGGVWALSTGVVSSGVRYVLNAFGDADQQAQPANEIQSPIDDRVAMNDPQPFDPESGEVTHFRPGAIDPTLVAPLELPGTAVAENSTSAANVDTPSLALIVRADQVAQFEQAVKAFAPNAEASIAVVRNVARPGSVANPQRTIAPGAGGGAKRGREVELDGMQAIALDGADQRLGRGQYFGRKELCPNQDRQFDLSDRGASHTVGITSRSLSEMLSHLSATQGLSTQLRVFPENAAAALGSSMAWSDAQRLSELRSIKGQLDQIRASASVTDIFLPVFVEAPDLTLD